MTLIKLINYYTNPDNLTLDSLQELVDIDIKYLLFFMLIIYLLVSILNRCHSLISTILIIWIISWKIDLKPIIKNICNYNGYN